MATLIVSNDCDTHQGLLMDINHKDLHDRYTSAPYKLRDGTVIKAGTLVTPEISSRLRNNKIDKVMVRSPLKCEHGDGICAKCFGLNENGKLHDVGTNIGVLAGQALGEPAVQMAMDAFHSGGIASSERGAKSVDRFTRLKTLLEMPETIRDQATIAMATGKIEDIKKDPVGGLDIFINGLKHLVPKHLISDKIKPGMEMKKGEPLSEGHINPHHLLNATKDIHAVQNHLVREMQEGLYEKEGVRRRNVEVAVRAVTNLTKVKDPGSSDHYHGDILPRTEVEEFNRNLPKGAKPIEHDPILKGVREIPSLISKNWMARLNYQRLSSTIQDAAAEGWKAEMHGSHPIPGIAMGSEFGKAPAGKSKHVY
jgi:DNA-directed RNA polymerase subunit beta'